MSERLHTALIDIVTRNGLFVAHTGFHWPLYELLAVFEHIVYCGDDRKKHPNGTATSGVTPPHNTIANGVLSPASSLPLNTSSREQFETRAKRRTGSAPDPKKVSRARGSKLATRSIDKKTIGLDQETRNSINRYAAIGTLYRSHPDSFIPHPS